MAIRSHRRRGQAVLAPVGRPLLCDGLRRRLPRDEFPALRRFCPGVEEHEPKAARLAASIAARPVTSAVSPARRTLRSLQAALLYFVFPERRDASHVALVSVSPEEWV